MDAQAVGWVEAQAVRGGWMHKLSWVGGCTNCQGWVDVQAVRNGWMHSILWAALNRQSRQRDDFIGLRRMWSVCSESLLKMCMLYQCRARDKVNKINTDIYWHLLTSSDIYWHLEKAASNDSNSKKYAHYELFQKNPLAFCISALLKTYVFACDFILGCALLLVTIMVNEVYDKIV